MSEEVKAKVKSLFPEDVEGIYISKNDYDRLYGDLTLENIELKQEIERLNKELEKYKYTADELGYIKKLEDRIEKAIKYIEDTSYKSYFSMLQADYNMSLDTLINILKGSDKSE